MDVSDFVHPGLGDPIGLAIFVAGVFFVAGFMASVTAMIYRPDLRLRLSFVLSLVCLGCTAITLILANSYASASEIDRNAGFESALLNNYGFTVSDSGPGVDEIQVTGGEGVDAQLNRDSSSHDVLLRIADGHLTITGSDGLEIPANA